MNEAQRSKVMENYAGHLARFDAAARRARIGSTVVPVITPLPQIEGELTRRELDVLQLIADGLTDRAISERLFIAADTVKSHVASMRGRLQAANRGQAVAVGFRRGLIT
jgi:LuxR family transcriptional regulator, maltose regulon positive regulatory protein